MALVFVGSAGMVWTAEQDGAQDKPPSREELQKLTPEERQARMKEWRGKQKTMTPEQREAQRKVWQERMGKKIEDLKKKRTEGSITPQEEQSLRRLEENMKRWQESGGTGSTNKPSGRRDNPEQPKQP